MIVVDTSAFISLSAATVLEFFIEEFDIHTTESVIEELQTTAEYDDSHGSAAGKVLDREREITVHSVSDPDFESSRVDAGEAGCALLVEELDADFLITDDLRALPELENLVDAKVAISPIVLKALVKKNRLRESEARERLELLAEKRDWLGAPIYRRAKNLF